MNYEFIGIIASILTLMSFCFKGEMSIRLVNALGCIAFVVYGLCIHAVSIYFVNSMIFVINVRRGILLYRERMKEENAKYKQN